jgi:hypothetical protein
MMVDANSGTLSAYGDSLNDMHAIQAQTSAGTTLYLSDYLTCLKGTKIRNKGVYYNITSDGEVTQIHP